MPILRKAWNANRVFDVTQTAMLTFLSLRGGRQRAVVSEKNIRTCWWWRQSTSRLSGQRNSLLTGKFAGNFQKLASMKDLDAKSMREFNRLQLVSLRNGTGKFCKLAGNFNIGIGNFECQNWYHSRIEFSGRTRDCRCQK